MLIKNGTVVNADRQFKADVLCENGVIVAIDTDLQDATAQVIDATGLLVMPGTFVRAWASAPPPCGTDNEDGCGMVRRY